MMTPYLVTKLRKHVKGPLLCKPNAGIPKIDENGIAQYDMTEDTFAQVLQECYDNGATLLGGCCGATPEHMATMIQQLKKKI
jgi:5-methyltetrahydrofolate--homocysteine methyltransferase